MNGERSASRGGKETVGGDEPWNQGASHRKVAPWPWWARPQAWTPWSWDETADQFQTTRKFKYEV